jgi:hypothetical protein
VSIRGLRIWIDIGSAPTKRYWLPPVSGVHIDATNGEITATVTNPYSIAISPWDYRASVVLYDKKGRIIGGDDEGSIGDPLTMKPIKPGRAPVADPIPDAVSGNRVAFARVTVSPK